MLPTLQQKLQIWTIRKSRAQNVNQATRAEDHPKEGAAASCQSSKTVPGEFRRHEFSFRDTSPSALDQPSTGHGGQDQSNSFKARGTDFDVAEALLRDLNRQVSSPTYLANDAAQDKSAYALDIPERLTNYIRQV
jgi:hypothetical protein